MAYVLLFSLLHGLATAQPANLGALLATAVANTAANRRLTFGVRGRAGAGRAPALGLLVFTVGLALTSGSLVLLHALAPRPPRPVEVAVLIAASMVATLATNSHHIQPAPPRLGGQHGQEQYEHTCAEQQRPTSRCVPRGGAVLLGGASRVASTRASRPIGTLT